MPGFRGIKMVSFDKKQKQMVQTPQPVENNPWPELAISILIDIMAGFHVYLVSKETENQREKYHQKAFEALSNHLMRLEKERHIPADFLGTLTAEKMKSKWQEIENTYRQIASTLRPDSPPGHHMWPFFDKMEFLYQSGYIRTPEVHPAESSTTQTQVDLPTENTPLEPSNSPKTCELTTDNHPPQTQPSQPSVTTKHESEEQEMIATVIEKIVPRVLEKIKDQTQSQPEHSDQYFQAEILRLKRRKVELLEERKTREETQRAETRRILCQLADVLEKLNDKL
ncbi:hypothetical protein G6F56_005426 [Rhizopus delemar]|uniref:Myb/SANT-like DNA-binding domain-containing protein n=1 Tax=Rhizopus stolonifer TaxID=4846 RepID=A0A367KS34_RHIST|nr:hypothetical protein G6F56_005426 [Rhizopus delemar]RCI04662.1 hypothetical protein CU098_013044 [Rhizopus stolonifer]